MKKDTRLIHEGMNPADHHDSLTVPLYQTSTFTFHSAEQGERRFAGEESGGIYSRLGSAKVAYRCSIKTFGAAWICSRRNMG